MLRRTLISAALLTVVFPCAFGKAPTSKITISGPDQRVIEVTDPALLSNFRIWAGPGASSNDPKSLIVDWSRGPVTAPPPRLQRYQIDFYANIPDERLMYVVQYEYDPSAGQGYVHIPGRGERWYSLDVSTIIQGIEGKWFHASSEWDAVARPLLARTK